MSAAGLAKPVGEFDEILKDYFCTTDDSITLSPEEKAEADARSIFVGNVSYPRPFLEHVQLSALCVIPLANVAIHLIISLGRLLCYS